MSAVATAQSATSDALEQYRRELTGYCYRMLGSGLRRRGRRAGDDGARVAVARPVRRPLGAEVVAVPDRDERLLRRARGAARPMDLGPAQEPFENLAELPGAWITPLPTPDGFTEAADRCGFTFVAALQHLPAKQRAASLSSARCCAGRRRTPKLFDTSVPVGQQRVAARPRDPGERPTSRSRLSSTTRRARCSSATSRPSRSTTSTG